MATTSGPSKSGPPPRMLWIDVARGIAMLMVVSSHAIEWTESASVSDVAGWWHWVNASAQLPVFFALSGFLFARSLSLTWREMLRRRVFPLLWVYVIWQPVVFAYKYLAGLTLPDQQDTSLGSHLLRFVLFPVRPSGELWFLWALAIFMVAGYAIRKWPAWVQLGLAALIAYGFRFADGTVLPADIIRTLGPGLSGLPVYFAFFLAGVVLVTNWKRLAAARPIVWAALIAVWAAVLIVTRETRIGDLPGITFFLNLVGVVGCVSVALVLQRVAVLQRVGAASINLYLVHTALIVFVLAVLHASGLARLPWQWWGVAILVAMATLLGLGFRRINDAGHLLWAVEPPESVALLLAPRPRITRMSTRRSAHRDAI